MKPFTHTPGEMDPQVLTDIIVDTPEFFETEDVEAMGKFLAASTSFPHPCTDKDCRGGRLHEDMLNVMIRLREWDEQQGNYEAKCWTELRALIAKLEGRA